MKKAILSYLLLCSTFAVQSQVNIINGDFEQTGNEFLPGVTDSPGWNIGCYEIIDGTPYNRSSNVLRLTANFDQQATVYFNVSPIVPGFISQNIEGSFQNIQNMVFNFKGYFVPLSVSDSCFISCAVFDTMSNDPNDDIILYSASLNLTGTSPQQAWSNNSIPFTQYASGNANKIEIFATQSKNYFTGFGNLIANSLLLDNISISSVQANLNEINDAFSIYPNPARNSIYINSRQEISHVKIYGLDGKLLIDNLYSKEIDLSSLKNGMYQLKVILFNGNESSEKFIKLD